MFPAALIVAATVATADAQGGNKAMPLAWVTACDVASRDARGERADRACTALPCAILALASVLGTISRAPANTLRPLSAGGSMRALSPRRVLGRRGLPRARRAAQRVLLRFVCTLPWA